MRINGAGPESTRPGGSGPVDKTSRESVKARKPGSSPARGDRVEISDAGRAAAAQLSGAGSADSETLSVERVEQIRTRIDAGTYDSREVQEDVARRILDAGDLDASGEG